MTIILDAGRTNMSSRKTETVNFKGNEYALVPARLKEFRQDNPRALVETKPHIDNENNTVVFSTRIVKDKADENSAEATGHSYGKLTEIKAFEKLETVSVGRALSLLGYLNNGQIASTEEMDEFEEFKNNKVVDAKKQIKKAKSKDEFASIMASLSGEQLREVTPLINTRIKELKDGSGTKN